MKEKKAFVINLAIIIILTTILMACGQDVNQIQNPPASYVEYISLGALPSNVVNNAYRFVDKEAGIVCWIVIGTGKAGISCLPMDQTNLQEGD